MNQAKTRVCIRQIQKAKHSEMKLRCVRQISVVALAIRTSPVGSLLASCRGSALGVLAGAAVAGARVSIGFGAGASGRFGVTIADGVVSAARQAGVALAGQALERTAGN